MRSRIPDQHLHRATADAVRPHRRAGAGSPSRAAPRRRRTTCHRALLCATAIGLSAVASLGSPRGSTAAAGLQEGPVEHALFAGRTYDTAIPRPAEVLGYELGDWHTTYEGMERYFRRLTALSDRVLLGAYGSTWERRILYRAVISSPENLGRLDDILDGMARLADPRMLGDEAEAERLLAELPAVVFLNYGTDGNETAAFEAAIHQAYQLAAATDAATRRLLDELVVVIVPAMNADSHERYVAWLNAFTVGAGGTAAAEAAEHDAPWGVATNNNHYQVDPNRDSVWSTQAESRALLALYRRFRPQVFVDHHGEYPGFTGPWMVEPLHAELTAGQRDWIGRYGEAMAATFSAHGYRYSPWEFGQFDPGYWDTLPNFTGSIAFTLETTGGGSRGLRRGGDGAPVYTLRDGIVQHLLADESVLQLTASHREELLRHYLSYRRTAISEGRRHPVQAYVLPAENDPERLETVVNLLLRDGIETMRTDESVEVEGAEPYLVESPAAGEGLPGAGGGGARRRRLSAGSVVVPMAQPEARLLRVLMEPEAGFTDEFLERIRRRDELRQRPGYFYGPGFYDITAWALPYTYDLEAYRLPALPVASMKPVVDELRLPGRLVGEGDYAIGLPYEGNRAIRAIADLQEGLQLHVATQPFRLGERAFGRGTVLAFADYNRDRDLVAVARRLVDEVGATVVRFGSALVDEGPHLGSSSFVPLRPTRIGVVMGDPVRTSAYGSIWFLMERRFALPFTALEFGRLGRIDLRDYDVLVLPEGGYPSAAAAAAEAMAALRRWIEAGGTAVGIGGAAEWLASEAAAVTGVRPAPSRDPDSGRRAETVPGSILRAEVWPHHWLSFGYEGEVPVHVWSDRAFVTDDAARVAVSYAAADRLRLSGFAHEEDLERLAGTPYLLESRYGAGRVVLFAEDPNFRVTWDGLTRLFFNALLLSRSF